MKVALLSLVGLGAIDGALKITPIGSSMSRFPLEPELARVLLASVEEGCTKEIIDLVSLLGQRDTLLVNSLSTREAAEQARKKFIHRSGDHMTTINILRAYEDVEKSERKAWCVENFINSKSMMVVLDTRKQLIERCKMSKIDPEVTSGDDAEKILGACAAGLFACTATYTDQGYKHTMSNTVRIRFLSIELDLILLLSRSSIFIQDRLLLTRRIQRSCTMNWFVFFSFYSSIADYSLYRYSHPRPLPEEYQEFHNLT